MLNLLAAFSEFERELIVERTRAGLQRVRAAGKTLGRPRRVFRRDEVARMRSEGRSWKTISEVLGVPASTIRSAWACEKGMVSGASPAMQTNATVAAAWPC
jgi:putative DNA-invertase from lambdoid prophage Rac